MRSDEKFGWAGNDHTPLFSVTVIVTPTSASIGARERPRALACDASETSVRMYQTVEPSEMPLCTGNTTVCRNVSIARTLAINNVGLCDAGAAEGTSSTAGSASAATVGRFLMRRA